MSIPTSTCERLWLYWDQTTKDRWNNIEILLQVKFECIFIVVRWSCQLTNYSIFSSSELSVCYLDHSDCVHTSKEKHKWVRGLPSEVFRLTRTVKSHQKSGYPLKRNCQPQRNVLKSGFRPYVVMEKPSLQIHLLLRTRSYFEYCLNTLPKTAQQK